MDSVFAWKNIKKYALFIGLILFVYLLFKLNLLEIMRQIENANPFYLFLALIMVFILLFIQTFKWWLIARKQKINVPYKEAFKINLITFFYGFITPGKLGSAIRAGYLKKYAKGIGKGISNFVIDKVLDLSSIFVMAIVFGFVFRNKLAGVSINLLYYLIALLVFMLICFFLLYQKETSKILLKGIYKKLIPKKLKNKAKITFNAFYEDLPKKMFLAPIFLIYILDWMINYAIIYFIGLSLGINLGFIYYLAILPLATLVAQIPITINGLGTREITMIGLFGLFNIEAVKVFSMSLINILIAGILPSLVALLLILKEKEKN